MAGPRLLLHGGDHRHLPDRPDGCRPLPPLLLLLAVGKVSSSLSALGFYLFDQHVFIYLLNFLVDGSLVLVALWLWSLIGRIDRPADPG